MVWWTPLVSVQTLHQLVNLVVQLRFPLEGCIVWCQLTDLLERCQSCTSQTVISILISIVGVRAQEELVLKWLCWVSTVGYFPSQIDWFVTSGNLWLLAVDFIQHYLSLLDLETGYLRGIRFHLVWLVLSCEGSIFSGESLFKIVTCVQITLELAHVFFRALMLNIQSFAFLHLRAKLLNVLSNWSKLCFHRHLLCWVICLVPLNFYLRKLGFTFFSYLEVLKLNCFARVSLLILWLWLQVALASCTTHAQTLAIFCT